MQSSAAMQAERGLVRAIGVRSLTATIINATIGAGIFVLPAIVARDLGSAAPLAYLACGLVMTLVMASFAIAGSRVSLTGGIYAYVEVAFGPLVGFVTGLLVWLACLLAAAGVASALAASMSVALPGVGSGTGKALLLAVIYGALAVINVRGVVLGTRFVEAMTVAKLLPLFLLIAAGVWWVRAADLAIQFVPAEQIGTTSITLIFAFVGVELALVPSGEIRDPARTVPRALFYALAITTVLYLVLQLVAHAVLGPALGTSLEAPLADVAAVVLGPWGRAVILVGGAVSMFGFLSGDMLGSPRTLFAFGRDGLVPAAMARLHGRYHTPWLAIVAHAAIAWAAAAIGTFGMLALLSNVALLSSYLICAAAAAELQRRDVRVDGQPFSVPGGPAVPLLTCLVLAWLLSHATLQEQLVTAVTVLVALALYGARAWRRRTTVAAEVAAP